jgi:hypothetical protein
LEPPSTAREPKLNRQFTGNFNSGVKYEPKKTLQSAVTLSWQEDDLRHKLYKPATNLQTAHKGSFGKTFNSSIF